MNLSVAGNTLAIPVYVNPTAGPEQTLGGYKLSICLPPPDVPVGTPGRAFQGAQLLDAKLTLNNVFTTPTGGGLIKWETLFTPYNPGIGTVERGRDVRGTRVRAAADHPRHSGQVQEQEGPHYVVLRQGHGRRRARLGLTLFVLRGLTAKRLARIGSAKTSATGGYSLAAASSRRRRRTSSR